MITVLPFVVFWRRPCPSADGTSGCCFSLCPSFYRNAKWPSCAPPCIIVFDSRRNVHMKSFSNILFRMDYNWYEEKPSWYLALLEIARGFSGTFLARFMIKTACFWRETDNLYKKESLQHKEIIFLKIAASWEGGQEESAAARPLNHSQYSRQEKERISSFS